MIIWIQNFYAYFLTCGDRRPDYALPAFIPASPIQVAILYQWGKCFRPLIKTIENRTLHQIISYSSTRVDKRLLICFTGNKSHAAIVIREHYDRTSHEIRPEEPLAGGVEVVAVAKSVHGPLTDACVSRRRPRPRSRSLPRCIFRHLSARYPKDAAGSVPRGSRGA